MRLEANISVRKENQKELPEYKVEIKNVNSFRFIKKAIDFEVDRQVGILELGRIPVQETRGFREDTGETFSQRLKEAANEYRYFPEPDIPPFVFSQKQIDFWGSELPELPAEKRIRLIKTGLSENKVNLIISDLNKYTMYQKMVDAGLQSIKAADIIINAPGDIINDLDKLISWSQNKQTAAIGKDILEITVKSVISQNPKALADYRAGKQTALFFMVGQVKKQLGNVEVGPVLEILRNIH